LSASHFCEPAPRFHAKTLVGEQFNNESTNGKAVLFQFWTTWCPYCKSEESLVNRLTAEFGDKGPVAIAVDVGESKKVVQQCLKEHTRKCHIVMKFGLPRLEAKLWKPEHRVHSECPSFRLAMGRI
jgi:thiol-disulfide isomerase/thioredoxin